MKKLIAALVIVLLAVPAMAKEKEKTVTLDVKDAEAREILKSMQTQCGIKNLVLDPDVKGTGTFFFRDVPCRKAFPIVLRTLGLQSVTYSNSVVSVGARKR